MRWRQSNIMARRFGRGVRPKVNRTWSELASLWSMVVVSVDTAVEVMGFEEPGASAAFTSMPPEDVIIDRVVGEFVVSIPAVAASSWTLGLLVVDRGWTPGVSFNVDCDKRILWAETYTVPATTGAAPVWSWLSDAVIAQAAADTPYIMAHSPRKSRVDITPRVRLVAGKALTLVAWENTGATTFSTSSNHMRVLWHRARR